MDLSHARLVRVALTMMLAASLGACATSRIENSWVEPTATAKSFALKKVLVVALARDGAIRRSTEDALARSIGAGPSGKSGQLVAEPSYRLLNDSEPLPVTPAVFETAKAKLASTRAARLLDGRILLSRNPEAPSLGDVRISYRMVPGGEISAKGRTPSHCAPR